MDLSAFEDKVFIFFLSSAWIRESM